MNNSTTVDAYIAVAPKALQERLKQMRETIKHVAPLAEEKISYGMPYYGYKGRLVYFAYFKNHIGMYIPTPTLADFSKELAGLETAKATVKFPHEKEIDFELVAKLVKARVEYNSK